MSHLEGPVAECIAQERKLLQPAVRSAGETLDQLLDPDFEEIGASGKLWSRQAIIEHLIATQKPPSAAPLISDEDMTGRQLADDFVLLTYVSDASGRRARRSSLWRRSGSSWWLLHHQGTVLP